MNKEKLLLFLTREITETTEYMIKYERINDRRTLLISEGRRLGLHVVEEAVKEGYFDE